MEKKYVSKNQKETEKLAKFFAEEVLLTRPGKNALVIGLVGELGTGKTTFIRSFIRTLGVTKKITSPTFLILRRYGLPKKIFSRNVFHVDAYRITSTKELSDVGVFDALRGKENIVLVEWADNIKESLPNNTFWITLHYGKNKKERHITFNRR